MSDEYQTWALALKTIGEQLLSEVDKAPEIVLLTCDLVQNDHTDRIPTYLLLLQYRQKLEYAVATMRVLLAASQQPGSRLATFCGLKDDIEVYANTVRRFALTLNEFKRRFLSGGPVRSVSDRRILQEIHDDVKRLTKIHDPGTIVSILQQQVDALRKERRSQFEQRLAAINQRERDMYDAADTVKPMKAVELLNRAGYKHDGQSKSYLAALVKAGLLIHDKGGYLKVLAPGSQDQSQN